jgi:hypothetical protein
MNDKNFSKGDRVKFTAPVYEAKEGDSGEFLGVVVSSVNPIGRASLFSLPGETSPQALVRLDSGLKVKVPFRFDRGERR